MKSMSKAKIIRLSDVAISSSVPLNVPYNVNVSRGTMNTRRVVRHHHVSSSSIPDSTVADSATLVTIEPSSPRDTLPAVANQDAVETRAQIVNPLWMVTVGLAILLALLAVLSASG
jgi:hypothetical protein